MSYVANFNNCSPGKGVLVKIGPCYYYPGHLIFQDPDTKQWTVEMWRKIYNEKAGKIQHVDVSEIVDGLWQDEQGRRRIQVKLILNLISDNPDFFLSWDITCGH